MSGYTERDVLRVEKKIAQAINEKREKRALDSYASEKIKNIYNFLDKVETDQESVRSSHRHTHNDSRISDDKENQIALQNYSESRSKFLNMQIELEEANKMIDSLKKVVEREKVRNKELELMYEQREEKKLKEQKEELEGIIQRHLIFIDQLVNDKKELNDQCENLMSELRDLEGKQAKQMAELKDKFQRELKTNKDAWMAAEKTRKEKWIQEKTAEIKEMTIRGLEPELERIMNKGKQDIKKIEDKHQREMGELREELYAEYETKLRHYKEKILRENDDTIMKEREYLNSKMKEQYDKVEQKYLEDRDKLKRTYEAEVDKVESDRKRDKEEYDAKIRSLQDTYDKDLRKVKEDYEDRMEAQKLKLKNEITNLKESIKIEQEQWFERENKRLKDEYDAKLKEIKAELEKERDEQIEVIISKLGEENVDAGFAVREKYERKIEDMREAHEEEIKKLKREIYVLDSHIKEGMAAKEAIGDNLEVLSKKLIDIQSKLDFKERECGNMKIALDDTRRELDKMLDVQRDLDLNWRRKIELEKVEMNAEREKKEEEIRDLKRAYEREIEILEEKQANILEDVEKKVKKAITKKDTEINRLKEELQVKTSACITYEDLLAKQRREFMHNM